jgi:hypothetical protein
MVQLNLHFSVSDLRVCEDLVHVVDGTSRQPNLLEEGQPLLGILLREEVV